MAKAASSAELNEMVRNRCLDFIERRESDPTLQEYNTTEAISEHLHLPKAPVDKAWTDLEKEGIIEKNPLLNFRVLTEKGRTLLEAPRNEKTAVAFFKTHKLSDKSKIVFLVGAGASAPAPSNIPPTASLLPVLWEKGRRLGKAPIDSLERWCATRGINNIEDVLTSAYVADLLGKERNISDLLGYLRFGETSKRRPSDFDFGYETAAEARRRERPERTSPGGVDQDTLSTLFHLLTATMIEAEPNSIHSAVAAICAKYPNASVVTTNYDCCLDEALQKSGLQLSYGFSHHDGKVVPLIKMHGSINWAYCDSCQTIFTPTIEAVKQAHATDLGFGVLGICRHCGGQRKPMLVPPLKFKYLAYPPLLQVWSDGQKAIDEADLIVSIGYSFSDSDDYILKMLLRSLAKSPDKALLLLNKSPAAAVRLRDRISRHNDAFPPANLAHLSGNAAVAVTLLSRECGITNGAALAKDKAPLPVPTAPGAA